MSQISEKSVDVVKTVCLERVSERSCEQGGVFEVSEISSQDHILHYVLVPQTIEQLVDVPKIVFQDRIQRQNGEQIADLPVLLDMWDRKYCRAPGSSLSMFPCRG